MGLAEEMDLTLRIMEKYIPTYFKNATQIYNREILLNYSKPSNLVGLEYAIKGGDSSTIHVNKNPLSQPVKNSTRILLSNHPVFILEYEFYEFVKQRLFLQAKYLKLNV